MTNPTHNEFKAAVQLEKKYVREQLTLWQAALEEATKKVEYWERQEEMIVGVSARVSLGDDSAFKGAKV